jgi:hypothetical protein
MSVPDADRHQHDADGQLWFLAHKMRVKVPCSPGVLLEDERVSEEHVQVAGMHHQAVYQHLLSTKNMMSEYLRSMCR